MILKKMNTEKFDDEYYTLYEYEDSSYTYEIINKIIESKLNIKSVGLSDNGDVGMKYFGGKYSFNDFLNLYNRISLSDIEVISFCIEENTIMKIYPEEKSVLVISNDNIKIEDLIRI